MCYLAIFLGFFFAILGLVTGLLLPIFDRLSGGWFSKRDIKWPVVSLLCTIAASYFAVYALFLSCM